jgi:hypothetical protein
MAKSVKVRERKLGRERAYGLYHEEGLIEIDPRIDPKNYLRVLIHEYLHHYFPSWVEKKVDTVSTDLGEFLWTHSYRKVSQ